MVIDGTGMEKKLTNSDPLREPTGKHSICTINHFSGALSFLEAIAKGFHQ
jgi:hypothetical protein